MLAVLIVKAGGGFVEDVDHFYEIVAELTGEFDSLGFPAGESFEAAIEGEISEVNVDEVLDLFGDTGGEFFCFGG